MFPLVLLLMGSSVQMASGHTWMFTKGNPNVFVSDAEQLTPVLSCSVRHILTRSFPQKTGRAWMQASLSKPFRARVTTAGQGTHAQIGPNQHMIVRWASSHNNTFSLAVVAAGKLHNDR